MYYIVSTLLTDLSPIPCFGLFDKYIVAKRLIGSRWRFGMVSGVGRGMSVLDGIHTPEGEGGGFGGLNGKTALCTIVHRAVKNHA